MAQVLYNHFADLAALEAEKIKVVTILGEVRTNIESLNKLGFQIDSSKSIAATAKAAQDLEKIQNQYVVTQSKLDAATERSRKIKADADDRENKAALSKLKLKDAEEKAEIKKQIALEKTRKAQEALNQAETNERTREQVVQNRIQALKEQEQAELDYAKSIEFRQQQEAEANAASAGGQHTALPGRQPVDSSNVAAVVQYKDALEELTGTLTENEALQGIYKKELSDVGKELKALDVNTSAAGKGTKAYQDKVGLLTGRQAALKRESSELGRTIRAQSIEQNSAAGSLENLRARLILATQAWERMGAAQRASTQGVALAAQVNNLTAQVSTLEQSTGRFQRNVGNYSNAIVKTFQTAFSGLRTLANILPGLGLSGIILLVVEAGQALYEMFRGTESAAKATQTAVKEAYKEATQEIGKQVGELQTLYKITQDTNQQLDDRKDATKRILEINKENNERTGEHTKLLVDQNGVLAENTAAYEELTKTLVRQAYTKAILASIEKAQTALIDAQTKSLDDQLGTFQNILATIYDGFQNLQTRVTGVQGLPMKVLMQGFTKAEAVKKAQGVVDGLTTTLLEGLKSGKFDLGGALADNKKGNKDAERAAEKARKDAQELFKFNMAQKIAEQKALAELENTGLNTRLFNRKKQAELEQQLNAGVLEFELSEKGLTEDAKTLLVKKANKERIEIEVRAQVDLIKIRAQFFAQGQIEADKELERLRKLEADKLAVRQEAIVESLQKENNQQTTGKDRELEKLERKFIGRINATRVGSKEEKRVIEQYNAEKEEINTRYQLNVLKSQLNHYTLQLELLKSFGLDVTKQEQIIADARAKIAGIEADRNKTGRNNKQKSKQDDLNDLLELLEKAKEVNDTINAAISGLINASAVRQKNEIQDQLDGIDKLKAAEIDRINASADSAERKAARIKIVEAKAQSDREALERRKREIDLQNARFEKAAAISSILLNTAIAVTKAIGNPFRVALAIFAGATQLAIAAATPLPKFFKGTDNAPEGHAHVAEQGRELTLDKKGKLRLFDKQAITYLTAGTKVFPNKVTEDILKGGNVTALVTNNRVVESEDSLDYEILTELRAIRKKSGLVIHNHSAIETTAYYLNNMKH